MCGGEGASPAKTSATAATTCHTLSSTGSWEQTHSLNQDRGMHSAWDSPQGTVLIGGWNGGSAWTTSEMLLENGDTTPGFNLNYQTR